MEFFLPFIFIVLFFGLLIRQHRLSNATQIVKPDGKNEVQVNKWMIGIQALSLIVFIGFYFYLFKDIIFKIEYAFNSNSALIYLFPAVVIAFQGYYLYFAATTHLVYDDTLMKQHNSYTTKKLYWNEIHNIYYSQLARALVISGKNTKIRVSAQSKGFQRFVATVSENVNEEKYGKSLKHAFQTSRQMGKFFSS